MIQNEKITPQESLAANGKTFNWACRFLGAKTGQNAARLYAFCRLLDDMADEDIPDGPSRLKHIHTDLNLGKTAKDPAFRSFQPFMSEMEFSPVVLTTLIDGLLQDQVDEMCLANEAELIRYAYKVAGTVGLLMCEVLNCKDPNAKAYAIDLGIGMQLTNIARDVLEDAHMGRRYIPGNWVDNIPPSAICAAADKPHSEIALRIKNSIKRLLKLADVFYKSGTCGYQYLPWRAHLSIAIAARIYRQIGVQIISNDCSWYQDREVTNNLTKLRCSLNASGSFLSRLLFNKNCSHDSSLHVSLRGLPHVS